MEKWTPKQVSDLVGSLGTANCWKQYAKIIIDEDLDGLTFQHLTQDNLMKLGFKELHAQAVVKARDKLEASPPPASPSSPILSSPPAYSAEFGSSVPVKSVQCNAHQRALEGYCTEDQQLVCITCMMTNHHGHRFEQIGDVFIREKANIEKLVSESKGRSQRWLKAAEDISAMRKQLQLNHDRVSAEMEKYFLSIEKQIRDRKEALRVELKGLVEEKLRMLTKQENDLRTAVSGLEKVNGSVQEYLKSKSPVECLELRQEMKQQLGQGGNQDEAMCEPQCGVDLEFVGEEKTVAQVIQRLGELSAADRPVASQCEARGGGLERVGPNSVGEFIIIPKNNKGAVIPAKGKDAFQVQVRSANTDFPTEVARQGDGTVKCTYKTDQRAKDPLIVSIMLQRAHIKGSPFTVKVGGSVKFLPQYCGKNLILSQDNTVVTKSGGIDWNGSALADGAVSRGDGSWSYRVKIISGGWTMVGFATTAINKEGNNYNSQGYYLHAINGCLCSQPGATTNPSYIRKDQAETVIECIWESAKQEIWFGVNGEKPQLAYTNVPANPKLYPAFDFFIAGESIELLQ